MFYISKMSRVQDMFAEQLHVERSLVNRLILAEHHLRMRPTNPTAKASVHKTRLRVMKQVKCRRMLKCIDMCKARIREDEQSAWLARMPLQWRTTNMSNYLASKTAFELRRREPDVYAKLIDTLHCKGDESMFTRIMEQLTSKTSVVFGVDTFDEMFATCACLVLAGVGFGHREMCDVPFATRVMNAPHKVVVLSTDTKDVCEEMFSHMGPLATTCPLLKEDVIFARYDAISIGQVAHRLKSQGEKAYLVLLDSRKDLNFEALRVVSTGELPTNHRISCADAAFMQLMAGVLYPVTNFCTHVIDSIAIVTSEHFGSWLNGFERIDVSGDFPLHLEDDD